MKRSFACALLLLAIPSAVRSENNVVTDRNTGDHKKLSSPVKPADASTEITVLVEKQAANWNKGDLEAFMSAYLPSAAVTYVSSEGEVRGYTNLLQRYELKYGSDQSAMGKLGFSEIKVTPLGEHNAFCLLKWNLERVNKPEMNGIATLILNHDSKIGWQILHDHTSVLEPKKN